MFQLFDKYRDMALAVKNPCHLNMAACLIKLKRYEEAIAQCSIVSIRFFSVSWLYSLFVYTWIGWIAFSHNAMLSKILEVFWHIEG